MPGRATSGWPSRGLGDRVVRVRDGPRRSAPRWSRGDACGHGGRGRQPRGGLADARHPGRLAGTQISFLGDAGTRSRTCVSCGSAQRRARRRAARLLDRHRRELPAAPPLHTGRARDRARARQPPSGGLRHGAHDVHDRPPVHALSRRSFPNNPGDAHAIQHYSSAPTLTPSTVRITTPAKPGAAPATCSWPPTRARARPGR